MYLGIIQEDLPPAYHAIVIRQRGNLATLQCQADNVTEANARHQEALGATAASKSR